MSWPVQLGHIDTDLSVAALFELQLSSEQAPKSAVWALLLNGSANYRMATQIPGPAESVSSSCGPLETPNLPHFCICGCQNRRQISVPAVSVPGPSLGCDWLPCGLPPKPSRSVHSWPISSSFFTHHFPVWWSPVVPVLYSPGCCNPASSL